GAGDGALEGHAREPRERDAQLVRSRGESTDAEGAVALVLAGVPALPRRTDGPAHVLDRSRFGQRRAVDGAQATHDGGARFELDHPFVAPAAADLELHQGRGELRSTRGQARRPGRDEARPFEAQVRAGELDAAALVAAARVLAGPDP